METDCNREYRVLQGTTMYCKVLGFTGGGEGVKKPNRIFYFNKKI